ncbi:MAG TPA: hypothetical protein VMZ90_09860, partial [Vicinamibacterales bacterium]|nr:hypothetical protein [Vicinamibacterales bacterium]
MPDTHPPYRIRAGQTPDIDSLARHRSAMFHDMGQLATQELDPLTAATAAYLRTARPAGDYLAWVAEETDAPGQIIGGAGAQLRPIMPRP